MRTISWISGLMVALAFVGMVDAAYVALHASRGFLLPCGFAGGCDQVLNSPYAAFLGIPVAWFGLAFYVTTAGCALFALFGFEQTLRLSFGLTALAFGFTLYLLYLQAMVIRAFCDYCLLSALLVSLIFILHLWSRRRHTAARREDR
ncbi:MAG: vitamin K epoxide reductase family protein [Acidobacteria bacterium]|nr:vitamin K epoxide reductase family protein [Acidobacteriota bacterium]MCI0621928.1 vitamin K epoxide reductase family protein [Acidobacteriota bacterium]MCI0719924.1 vitamin K epoxide reductase family protein [Acidobacteriota bacterium]